MRKHARTNSGSNFLVRGGSIRDEKGRRFTPHEKCHGMHDSTQGTLVRITCFTPTLSMKY